jgi:hypothetical protein
MPNTVYISAVIDAPVEEVWKIMRDYNGMPSYHPGIKHSLIEDSRPSDQVGCVRRLTLSEGFVREVLLCMDDRNYIFTYGIIEGTLPVRGYVAGVAHRVTGQPYFRGSGPISSSGSRTRRGCADRKQHVFAASYRGRSKTGWKAFLVRYADAS